jgi:hypothetical protein
MVDLYCNLQDLALSLEKKTIIATTCEHGCRLALKGFLESSLQTSSADVDTYHTPGMVFSNSASIYASNTKSISAATLIRTVFLIRVSLVEQLIYSFPRLIYTEAESRRSKT